MKKLMLICVLMSGAAQATPFLVCDPYPPSVPQPTEFVISVVGQASPVVVAATPSDQGAYLHWDVAGQTGAKTLTVKARNAWGESVASAPFAYVAGVPGTPGGLTLAP